MATDVVLHPVRVPSGGFAEVVEHRRDLHLVYNQYARCSADRGHEVQREAEQSLLRPLFITSFLIDDLLADNGFFGAQTVVLSSASSKTAYGTAFCLSRRRGGGSTVKVVGLTSSANIDFTKSLGCYDEVIGYEGVESLDSQSPTTYVDFSGNTALRSRVHLISKMVQPAQVVAHAMSYLTATMRPPEQEVGHGAEQSAVPARAIDAGILPSVRFAGAV